MDSVTKDRYLLNYGNRMKLKQEEDEKKAFQKEEEKTFRMIPERPKLFGVKTEDVNYDKEDYNNINILPACETASNEAEKSINNKSLSVFETAANEISYPKWTTLS